MGTFVDEAGKPIPCLPGGMLFGCKVEDVVTTIAYPAFFKAVTPDDVQQATANFKEITGGPATMVSLPFEYYDLQAWFLHGIDVTSDGFRENEEQVPTEFDDVILKCGGPPCLSLSRSDRVITPPTPKESKPLMEVLGDDLESTFDVEGCCNG